MKKIIRNFMNYILEEEEIVENESSFVSEYGLTIAGLLVVINFAICFVMR